MKSACVKTTILGLTSAMLLSGSITAFGAQTSLTAGASSALASAISGEDSTNETSVVAGVTSVLSKVIEESAYQEDASLEKNTSNASQSSATDTTYGYKNLGVASCDDYVNIRKSSSKDSELVGKLKKNSGCEILKTKGSWTKIKSGKVTGWVKSEYLLTGEKAKKKADKVAKSLATVNTETLNIRSEKSTNSSVVAQVGEDTDLTVLNEGSQWVKVKYKGKTGYVSADYVSVSVKLKDALTATEAKYGEGVSDVRSKVVSYALQFVGNPYVWGGTSLTNGVDCSGFTMRILGAYGVGLPHSSSGQSHYGKRISASEAKPGDLFFYGSGGISHVAIYIGNGQIVHASNKKDGIKVSNAFYRTPICVCSYFN